ncbi:MAG: hypothetical protein ACPGIC_04775 [Opitutales bacterium]
MMRTLILHCLSLSGICAPLAAAPFAASIQADAHVVFSIRDTSELFESWQEHPVADVFADESLQAFFKPLFADEDRAVPGFTEVMEAEFGLTWEQLVELMPGQVAMMLYNLPDLVLQGVERPDLAMIAEFSGSPKRLNELMRIQFERNARAQKEINPLVEHEMIEATFMGETLYFDETFDGQATYIEDGYALVDGIFILATPEERLRSMVEAVKLGPSAALADCSAYQRVREESGRGDVALYFNLESLLPPLNRALQDVATGGLALFGVSGQSLNAALALDALEAFGVGFDMVDEGILSYSSIVYREKAGLMRLLAHAGGELPDAAYVPEKVLSSSVTLFDPSAMLANLESILGTASPTVLPLIDIQLRTIQARTGVDFRAALLENFAQEVVTLSVLADDLRGASARLHPDQLFVLTIRDAEALSGALEALKDLIPGARAQIETIDFGGETIHRIKGLTDPSMPDAPASDFSFVITRRKLLINVGRVGLLQQVLSAMQTQKSGFWQLPETEALFEAIERPGAIARSYHDLGAVIAPLLHSMAQASGLAGEARALDASQMPEDLYLPWHVVSESNEAPDGLFTRSFILRKESAE